MTNHVQIPDAAVQVALDTRLKAAGMYTIEEIMAGTPVDKWRVHTGMNNLQFFGEWLERKAREYKAMAAGYDLGDKDKSDELYEWVLAHSGAFHDVLVNFRAALTAAYLHLPLGVKVDQLVWSEYEQEGSIDRWDAEACGFHLFYDIQLQHDGYRVVFDHEAVGAIGVFGTLEEAKAAAQADFERRVRECLVDQSLGNSEQLKPVDLTFMAQSMLSTWERWISTESKDKATETQATDLLKAACFAGLAYEDMMASPITADAAPSALLRIFLTAIIDPTNTELDAHRAKNRPDATFTNEGTKPADVVAVRRQALEINFMQRVWANLYFDEHDAGYTFQQTLNDVVDWLTSRNALPDAEAIKPSAIRALSAEPAQGEQWQPIETAPKDGTEILAWREDCGWLIVSYTSLDAFPMTQSELDELDEETLFKKDWFTQFGQFRLEGSEVPTHWMPLPAAPTTEAGT